MVRKNANGDFGQHVGLNELKLSFYKMLEESSVSREFWPILFESFRSTFKVDSFTKIEIANSIIKSTDNSTFNFLDSVLNVSRKRIIRGIFISSYFILLLVFAALTPRSKRLISKPTLFFGFELRFVKNQIAKQDLIHNLDTILPNLVRDGHDFLFESREKLKQKFYLQRSSVFPYVALKIFNGNYRLKNRLTILNSVVTLASKMMIRNRNVFFLAPERAFLELSLWHILLVKSNIEMITTQSKLELLPVAFYAQTGNRSMVWYSNNSLPFHKIGHKSIAPSVATNSDYIDRHYVWSRSHKEFLEKQYPKSNISVVGPILFESQDSYTLKRTEPRGILYFDVTPFDYLKFETFYSIKMCSEALLDLIQIAQALGIQLLLKPKRPYLRNQGSKFLHSAYYLTELDRFETNRMLTTLDPGVSIRESILNCQIVIGLPFTSPVLVAAMLDRPSVYYAPLDAGDWELPSERDGILVIRGQKDLFEYLNGIIT